MTQFSTRPFIVSVLILIWVALISSCSSDRSWPPKDYVEIRAYLYNLDSKDHEPVVVEGRLSDSVTNERGIRLSDEETTRFLEAVTGVHQSHRVGLCYIPHHAYVFFDRDERIVGWVEICFECFNYLASSPRAPKSMDLSSLRQLTGDLGIPVLNHPDDYVTLKQSDTD